MQAVSILGIHRGNIPPPKKKKRKKKETYQVFFYLGLELSIVTKR